MKPDEAVRTQVPRAIDGKKEIVDWRAKVHFSAHHRFTWRERLLILFGFELDVFTTVITEKHPGKYFPKVETVVTPLTQMRDVVKSHKVYADVCKVFKLPAPAIPESVLEKENKA